jgi:signal transduction histidine kinase/ActR/RegA family two-component response regulator
MTEPTPPTAPAPAPARALVRSTDWSRTPLGPIEGWPRTLRGYVEMILDLPSPAIIFWGPEQTQIYNDGYAAIMGPRHPRYFGAPYRESWPDTYPLIYPWMRHVLDEGGAWKVEREPIAVTRHGFDEEAFFTFTFSPLLDDDGRIAGILQPVFEVTGSVLADRRAETLRLLLPERQSAFSPVDDALAAMAASPADLPFAHVWLWDAEGSRLVPAGRCGAALSEADGDRLDAAARAVRSGAGAHRVDALAAVGAGVVRGALVLPLEGAPDAAPAGVIALGVSRRLHDDERYRKFLELVARQVAAGLQRAQAARAAERQRQYLSELFMQAPAGIAVLAGPEHVFELVNPAFGEFIGSRDLLGKPLREALPELRGQDFPEILDGVFRSGVAFVGNEAPAQLSRGVDGQVEEAFFNFVYQPLRDERGVITGILVFAYEVTEQVNARRKVEHLADELRIEHRRKDDFLAMLAHELRNPLAPISAAAQVLRLAHAGDARLRRTSDIVARQVRHMATLIDDLLDASRVTRGLVSIERADEDLADIIAAAVEQVAPQAEGRRQRLRVVPGAGAVRVCGDRKRLVQVLTNVLDNASKYTPEGGSIELRLERDGAWATLHVRDDGQGVPPELCERIFDLFVQGQRGVDRAQGGLGIGLALARRLVELHGGTLTCASEGPGRGSEFRIALPCLAAASPVPDAAPPPPAAPPAAAPAQALRILVVDDNEDAADMLAMLLEGAGHEVVTANDPFVALERAQALPPDVCLLDIGLPHMDGHELARRLRATPGGRAATLVALTGYGQAADRAEAARAGFDHYLLKPPDPEALERLLRSVAARPRQAGRAR